MGIILTPVLPIAGFLAWIGIGIFQASTCEKALEYYQKEMSIREARIAELEPKLKTATDEVERLKRELNRLQGVEGENAQLKQENGSFREQLAAAREQHQALLTSQAKVSKDAQADLEDLGRWFDKELQKRQDLVDNINITRWHEKTEYGKKLAEYQRLLRQAAAESGGLRKDKDKIAEELRTARGTREREKRELALARQDLDQVKQEMAKALAEKDAKHRKEIFWYRLATFLLVAILVGMLLRAWLHSIHPRAK